MEADPTARRVYVLPSRGSEEQLLDMLRGPESYFGERPDVWSWADLYRNSVPRGETRRQIDPPDHMLILRHILRRTLRELDAAGISVPPGVRRRGFLEILSSALKELMLEDVAPDRLVGAVAPVEAAEIAPRDLLGRLYTDYLLYLEESRLADSAQLPSLAAASSCLRPDSLPEELAGRTLCWVGFLSFTGAQLKLIRTLRDCGLRMEFYIPHTGGNGFYDVVRQLDEDALPPESTGLSIAAICGQERYAQYERVAREIALCRAGGGPLADALLRLGVDPAATASDVGVLTEPAGMPLLVSALRKQGLSVQVRSETAVSATPLLLLVRRVWDAYRAAWPALRTYHLLRDSLFAVALPEEKAFWEAMPEGGARWRAFLRRHAVAAALFERLEDFGSLLSRPDGHTAAELLASLLSLAEACGWEGNAAREAAPVPELDDAVRETASALLEIRNKLEAMREMSPAIGPAAGERFSGAEAVAFLFDWMREMTTMLPSMLSGAVTVYDAYPSVLVSHRLWIMTDVDASRFPGPPAEHALLDGSLREEINRSVEEGAAVHLPTLHERREQQEAVFRRLLAVGERLTLVTRSSFDSQGRPLADSPFFSALSEDSFRCPVAIDESASGDTGAQPLLPSGGGMRRDRGSFPRVLLQRPPARAEKIRVPASAIDLWLDCPFSYWCERVARLEPPQDAPGMSDRRLLGNVMHEAWRAVWEEKLRRLAAGGCPSVETLLWERWDLVVREYPVLADPRAHAALAELRARMGEAAVLQDDIEKRAAAVGLLRDGALLEFPLPPLELENVVFTGTADRVDEWRGVGRVFVDYKLGRAAAYRSSLQLAAYAVLLRAAPRKEAVVGFGYLSHTDGSVRGSWTQGLDAVYEGKAGSADMEEKLAAAAAAMREIDAAFGAGCFPAQYDSTRCRYCPYPTVCRRTERYGHWAMGEEELDAPDFS